METILTSSRTREVLFLLLAGVVALAASACARVYPVASLPVVSLTDAAFLPTVEASMSGRTTEATLRNILSSVRLPDAR